MIKRLIAITIMVALVTVQAGIAGAFVSDVVAPAITASVNLSTGTAVAKLAVAVKTVSTGTAATTIGWTGVNLGGGWKAADQYVDVAYIANQVGWGVQIYTDNKNGTPPYGGNPATNVNQQPAGLIGQTNTLLTARMAILTVDDTLAAASIAVPHEVISGENRWFDTGYDKTAGGAHEYVWFFLKDKQGTRWNGTAIVPTFANGEDYATIVKTNGYSSGWVDAGTGLMQRDAALGAKDRTITTTPAYSLNVYFAADFTNATELQVYETDTLTLELYHT